MRIDEPTIAIRICTGDAISLWLGKTDDDVPAWFEFELSLDKARELRHAARSKDEGKGTT